MISRDFRESVIVLLAKAGFKGEFTIRRLQGGANNRVYRIALGGRHFLLKNYFKHPADKRDRLKAEFLFSNFAWNIGLRCLPQPFNCNPGKRLALYEFIEGKSVVPQEVDEKLTGHALHFFHKLNCHKNSPEAQKLPAASEACFSISLHLQCVARRVQNLCAITATSSIDRQALAFIRGKLSKVWQAVRKDTLNQVSNRGFSIERGLAMKARCISPSDFGFHNALMLVDNSIKYIDFEYAGWDDPAKTVCDFFCQPEVPVPMKYFDGFVKDIVSGFARPAEHAKRIVILFPAYQVKWCCILLNNFRPVGARRRLFASDMVDEKRQKTLQLQKAERMLAKIEI